MLTILLIIINRQNEHVSLLLVYLLPWSSICKESLRPFLRGSNLILRTKTWT